MDLMCTIYVEYGTARLLIRMWTRYVTRTLYGIVIRRVHLSLSLAIRGLLMVRVASAYGMYVAILLPRACHLIQVKSATA